MLSLLFQPFKQTFSFQGRATRLQYWLFVPLWMIILAAVIGLLGDAMENKFISAIITIVAIAIFIASISLSVRRLHDTNRSGWWYWVSIIPLIGPIWIFVLFCLDGTKGKNRFGVDPKGR